MKRLEEIALFTDDVDELVAFYTHFLGMPPASWSRGEAATFQLAEVTLFLHRRSEEPPAPGWPPGQDHIAFTVANVDDAAVEARAAGLAIEVGPGEFYWGRSVYLRDPDGRLVEMHQADHPE